MVTVRGAGRGAGTRADAIMPRWPMTRAMPSASCATPASSHRPLPPTSASTLGTPSRPAALIV